MNPIRLIELFSGIGAFSKALSNLGIPCERVAMCEINPYAIKAYEALHGETPNLGDISQVKDLPECDLLTYSFPCQDLSRAGARSGMSRESGSRSGLLWHVERLLSSGGKPRYLIMENVEAILDKTNVKEFRAWVRSLTGMGYTSSYAVMDASDYGVPQKRRRCFMVSSLGHDRFRFPDPCPDGRVLKDVLESNVSDRYFLSKKAMDGLIAHKARHDGRGHGFGFKITESESVASAVTTRAGRNTGTFIYDRPMSPEIRICNADGSTSKAAPNDCIRIANAGGNGTKVSRDYALTVLAEGAVNGIVTNDLWVRRLTPREYWRLQGFDDSDFDTVRDLGISDTQLYKLAGNSIPVPCLEAIFHAMYFKKNWLKTPSLDAFLEKGVMNDV